MPEVELLTLLDDLKYDWGDTLQINPNGAFCDKSEITKLPLLVAEPFSHVSVQSLARFCVAAGLFSDAILILDDVIDYASTDSAAPHRVPNAAILFFESCRLFGQIFPEDSAFWVHARRYFADYVNAISRERAFADGRRGWSEATEEGCIQIACGKNGLIRLVAAAVSHIAGEPAILGPAEQVLVSYFVGSQMLDDLHDWREDLLLGNISVLLRRVCTERPGPRDVDDIRKRLYQGEHIEFVLRLSESMLRSAMNGATQANMAGLSNLIRRRVAQVRSIRLGLHDRAAS